MAVDTVVDLIDKTISYVDNIDVATAEVAKRARYREFAEELVHDLVIDHEWVWMWTEAEVQPDSNGSFVLPTRFLDVGRFGGLVLKSNGDPFENCGLKELREDRYTSSGGGRDRKYAIGLSEEGGEERYGWVPRGWSGEILLLSYRRHAPVLVDDDDDTGLLEIPRQYREGLLVYGMRARACDDKGDNRASKWETRYEKALNAAIVAERPQKDEGLVMGGSGYADQC